MKKYLALVVALVAIAMGVQAQSITSLKAKVSINGGAVMEQELPATGFPIPDLTDQATTSFVIKDIIVGTSGSVSNVSFWVRVQKVDTSNPHEFTEVPLTYESGVWHVSASTLEQLGFPNGVELVEPSMSSDPRYLEFYIVANNSISWNNGGENYKIKFSTAGETEAKVKFYKEGTAGINIIADSEEKDITYTGDFVREKWYGWQPGEVSSLVIDDIFVTVSCEDGSLIKSVSMQYKVYEEGQEAQWNTHSANYKAQNLLGGWLFPHLFIPLISIESIFARKCSNIIWLFPRLFIPLQEIKTSTRHAHTGDTVFFPPSRRSVLPGSGQGPEGLWTRGPYPGVCAAGSHLRQEPLPYGSWRLLVGGNGGHRGVPPLPSRHSQAGGLQHRIMDQTGPEDVPQVRQEIRNA